MAPSGRLVYVILPKVTSERSCARLSAGFSVFTVILTNAGAQLQGIVGIAKDGKQMRQAGLLVERMKKGDAAPDKHFNPYLHEAMEYGEILFTGSEWAEKNAAVFDDADKPLLIEVGCYMGKNVLEFANHNSGWNVLGIDITYKRVVKTARKIKNLNIKNAKILISDARAAIAEIPDGTLAGVCVFFPDPWPKKKQLKNRLLQGPFLDLLARKLKPEGFFWFKTDSEDYFANVRLTLENQGWAESAPDALPDNLEPLPYTTVFEALFTGKNLPIYRRVFLPPRK